MAVRKKKLVESGLETKGFQKAEGDHHFYFYWTRAGRKTPVRTHTSHGSLKSLGNDLLGAMARQVRLTQKQFLDLVDCPMSREEYETILRDNRQLGETQ